VCVCRVLRVYDNATRPLASSLVHTFVATSPASCVDARAHSLSAEFDSDVTWSVQRRSTADIASHGPFDDVIFHVATSSAASGSGCEELVSNWRHSGYDWDWAWRDGTREGGGEGLWVADVETDQWRHQPASAAAAASWRFSERSFRHGRTQTSQYITGCQATACRRSRSSVHSPHLGGHWSFITARTPHLSASELRRRHWKSDPTASVGEGPRRWTFSVHLVTCRWTSIACSLPDRKSWASATSAWRGRCECGLTWCDWLSSSSTARSSCFITCTSSRPSSPTLILYRWSPVRFPSRTPWVLRGFYHATLHANAVYAVVLCMCVCHAGTVSQEAMLLQRDCATRFSVEILQLLLIWKHESRAYIVWH